MELKTMGHAVIGKQSTTGWCDALWSSWLFSNNSTFWSGQIAVEQELITLIFF